MTLQLSCIIVYIVSSMDKTTTTKQSKRQGSKLTKVGTALLTVFEEYHLPLSETELRAKLSELGIEVNKTTIYRQLARLKESNIIREIVFGDGKQRFELSTDDHHHHLVCTNCNTVDDVYVEDDVIQIGTKVSKTKKFRIINHSLEFFGLCHNCT